MLRRFRQMCETRFALAVDQRNCRRQFQWNRLPQCRFRQGAHVGDFGRKQRRWPRRRPGLNRLRCHSLQRGDRRGDERHFRFRDRQNIAVRQKRFAHPFAVHLRAVGAAQIANRPDVSPAGNLRMLARNFRRVDPQIGGFAAPDFERAVFDRHTLQLAASAQEVLEARTRRRTAGNGYL